MPDAIAGGQDENVFSRLLAKDAVSVTLRHVVLLP
jgi:hypothetical protein